MKWMLRVSREMPGVAVMLLPLTVASMQSTQLPTWLKQRSHMELTASVP